MGQGQGNPNDRSIVVHFSKVFCLLLLGRGMYPGKIECQTWASLASP